MNKLISVVIPVFNEEECLPALFKRLDALEKDAGLYRWEFIFVNDGSSDKSESMLKEKAGARQNYVSIHLSRNFGHQFAITAGLDYADGDAVAIIDADLQDPPEAIIDMLGLWEKGYPIVYGKRRSRCGENALKKWTSSLFYRILSRLTDVDIPLDTGDFRLIDKKVADIVKSMRESHRFLRGMIAWTGFYSVAYEYDRQPRMAGKTKFSFGKMIRFALNAIFSFSEIPLRMASYLGLFVIFLAVLGILFILYLRLFTTITIPGISTVLILIMFFGGIQLLVLGIIGEYVGRIFDGNKKRPLYLIKDINNKGFLK